MVSAVQLSFAVHYKLHPKDMKKLAGKAKTVAGGEQAWRCIALRALEAGEPINWCYSKDPNHLILTTQGFIIPENPFNRVMAKPADLRKCLDSVAAPAVSDFARWRTEEIAKQLPDPEPDAPGAALFVVGAAEGGVQWNPLWLNLCGLAVSADGQTHWNQQPGGKQRYYNALERATLRSAARLSLVLSPQAQMAPWEGQSASGAAS